MGVPTRTPRKEGWSEGAESVESTLRWGGAGVLLYEKQVPCLPLSSPPIFQE